MTGSRLRPARDAAREAAGMDQSLKPSFVRAARDVAAGMDVGKHSCSPDSLTAGEFFVRLIHVGGPGGICDEAIDTVCQKGVFGFQCVGQVRSLVAPLLVPLYVPDSRAKNEILELQFVSVLAHF